MPYFSMPCLADDPGPTSSATSFISVNIPHKLSLINAVEDQSKRKLAFASNFSGPFMLEVRSRKNPKETLSFNEINSPLEDRELPAEGIIILMPQ